MSEALRHEMRKVGLEEALQTLLEMRGQEILEVEPLESTPRLSRKSSGAVGLWNWSIEDTYGKVLKMQSCSDGDFSAFTYFCVLGNTGTIFDIRADLCRLRKKD